MDARADNHSPAGKPQSTQDNLWQYKLLISPPNLAAVRVAPMEIQGNAD